MGKPSMFPPGPVTQQCEEGREWFRRVFKPHARQVSQPTYLKTVAAVLGDTVFHSSQYTGLCLGTLKEPTPKVFLALGLFNQAVAEGRIPAELKHKWVDPKPMVSSLGQVYGPAELFLIFVGALDPGLPEVEEIPQEKESEVTRILGKFVRVRLASKGVDFVVEDQQRLLKAAPSFKGLLGGKDVVRGDVLVGDLPRIAQELELTTNELWDVITPVITEESP